MAIVGQVLQLWRYPVSSLGGERVRALRFSAGGTHGDRGFGVVDATSGRVGSPADDRRWRPLPRIGTRLSPAGQVELSTDGQEWIEAPSRQADALVSAFLGFEASVRPYPTHQPPGYGGPLAENRYRPSPIHLLTTASLARLKALHPTGSADPRRFRPNILVDLPAIEGSFPETEWVGRKLRIGALQLTISEPCRRCGFTIIEQDDFGCDPEILRTLVRSNAHNIGVYCTVDAVGTVELGDRVGVG